MTLVLPEVGDEATSVTFDRDEYLSRFDPDLLGCLEGRRLLTKLDPLAFGLVYLGDHLTDTDGEITFSDTHLDWVRAAREWMTPCRVPKSWRHAFVGPRETGKSTWWHLVIPLWAAAHGWAKFIAAFSDSGPQSAIHLGSFKHELDTNRLLREDFSGLCTPSKRPSGVPEADSQSLYIASNGFVLAAKGIDSKNLGLKVGRLRPDVIIMDDVEPDESSYSPFQAVKRLRTITDAILPMNEKARVVLVGTVTMPGSIIHQAVKAAQGVQVADWIKDERFRCHHYRPIVIEPDGSTRSIWPGKWPLSYLEEVRGTRSYQKNFDNDPAGAGGTYWTPDDFVYGDLPEATRTLISVDPSTTTNTTSDPAGVAVISFAPPRPKPGREELAKLLDAAQTPAQRRAVRATFTTGRCAVRKVWAVKLVGEPLRSFLLRVCAEFPEARLILVESNQGGEHWHAILHDMPAKVVTVHNTVPKETRAGDLLNHYQMGRVVHDGQMPDLEGEMGAFPHGAHDDMVDAVGNGVFRFIPAPVPKKKVPVSSETTVYA